jgi:cytochrome c-type biogenesis protein CcmH/NrfG
MKLSKTLTTIITILVTVILLFSAVAIPTYFENRKLQRANNERIQTVAQEMKKNNEELYNNLIKSVEDNKKIIESDPNKQDAWLSLGAAYQNLGDYIQAKEAYNTAIKISDQTQVGWNNLADIYIKEESYESAEETYLKWIAATKEDSAYLRLAEMYASGHEGTALDAGVILERGIKETRSPSLQDALQRLQLNGKL